MLLVAVIGVAGRQLPRNGDIIAEKTGISGSWIGLILIASVTSLPELVTGISAVAYWNLPDIAVGDALGSCVLNLAMLIVIDFMVRGESAYTRPSTAAGSIWLSPNLACSGLSVWCGASPTSKP